MHSMCVSAYVCGMPVSVWGGCPYMGSAVCVGVPMWECLCVCGCLCVGECLCVSSPLHINAYMYVQPTMSHKLVPHTRVYTCPHMKGLPSLEHHLITWGACGNHATPHTYTARNTYN